VLGHPVKRSEETTNGVLLQSLINLLIEEMNTLSSNKFFNDNIQMIFEIIEHPAFKTSDKEEVMGAYIGYCFKLDQNIDNQVCVIASMIVRSQVVRAASEQGMSIQSENSPFDPYLCCFKALQKVSPPNQAKFDQNVRLLVTHVINGKYQSCVPNLSSKGNLPPRFTEKIGNLKRIFDEMADLYSTAQPKILKANLIESIVEYRVAIKLLSMNPEWLTIDIKMEIEKIVESILASSAKKENEFAYLIITRDLYRIYLSSKKNGRERLQQDSQNH
jgi:hypothetical protein